MARFDARLDRVLVLLSAGNLRTANYNIAVARELQAICAKNNWPLWGMFNPAYDWLYKSALPSEFYSRDYVHSGELGKQLIARITLAYFTAAAKAK